jgi:AcrR family transcriptional regulator
MARRMPGIRLRMEEAALELFEAHGIANTTAAQVAAAAGTTERTFFRHFRTKVDAAFGDESRLRGIARDAVTAAPEGISAFGAVLAGLQAIAEDFGGHRDSLLRRARVVAANPELQEHERNRGAEWAALLAEGLAERGVGQCRAVMLAGVGLVLYRAAYERWIAEPHSDLSTLLREVVAEFRTELSLLP